MSCNIHLLGVQGEVGVVIHKVQITSSARKDLEKVPPHILKRLMEWIDCIEELGINAVRMNKGLHDEPLQGKRKEQRSIRLNRSYRAIYVQDSNQEFVLIEIIEVNKHEY